MSTQALCLRAAPRVLVALLASVASSCTLDWDQTTSDGGSERGDDGDDTPGSADDDSGPNVPPVTRPDAGTSDLDATAPALDATTPLRDAAIVVPTSADGAALPTSCTVANCRGTNETCNLVDGYASCGCNSGYERVGNDCKNVNECVSQKPCGPDQTCSDTPGSYLCTCPPNGNRVLDSDFEAQPRDTVVALPWRTTQYGAPEVDAASIYAGQRSLANIGRNGWQETWQRIDVLPHSSYTFEAFLKTSPNAGLKGAMGVRPVPAGKDLVRYAFTQITNFTRISTTFETKDETQVDIYFGNEPLPMNLPSIVWVDDVLVQRVTTPNGGCP